MNRVKYYRSTLMVFIILLMMLAYLLDWLRIADNSLYDSFFEKVDEPRKEIVIVGIDDLTYNKIGRWPFSRKIQSQIFDKILQGNPSVLGIDIVYDSYLSQEEDEYIINSLKGQPVVLASVLTDNSVSSGSQNNLLRPIKELEEEHLTGYINTKSDSSDGIIRQVQLVRSLDNTYIESFAYQIYLKYMAKTDNPSLVYKERLLESKYINYTGGSGTIEVVSAQLVLSGVISPSFFENRIVLFGPYTVGMQDDYYTPIDKQSKTYGIEIHGNIIQNLLNNQFKEDLNKFIELLFIVLFGLISYFIGVKLSIKYAAILQGGLIGGLLGIGTLLYQKGYVAHIVYSMVTVMVISLMMVFVGYFEQMMEKRRITGIFGRYVAPQIVNQILEAGEAHLKLGGKRKEISVLFVDIRGFTPLSEAIEPEEAVKILNDYLELCTKVIFDNQGTLDKFIGDAAMALYNAPMDLEAHAYYAVKTAYDMKIRGEILSKDLYERFGKKVHFGIGVNTGKAVVGNIGSNVRMDYTAIGDAVNIASRLESNAKPGQILISSRTYELAKEHIVAKHLGYTKVKGKEIEIDVYEVEQVVENKLITS